MLCHSRRAAHCQRARRSAGKCSGWKRLGWRTYSAQRSHRSAARVRPGDDTTRLGGNAPSCLVLLTPRGRYLAQLCRPSKQSASFRNRSSESNEGVRRGAGRVRTSLRSSRFAIGRGARQASRAGARCDRGCLDSD